MRRLLGTDGSGSVRIPAAFCGVVGYKPTLGRIPYAPNSADRLAHLGPLTRTVADAALLTRVMAGPHPDDPDSALTSPHPRPATALRIGWIDHEGTTGEVRRVTAHARLALTAQGHRVEDTRIPTTPASTRRWSTSSPPARPPTPAPRTTNGPTPDAWR